MRDIHQTCGWVLNTAELILKLQPVAENFRFIFSINNLQKSLRSWDLWSLWSFVLNNFERLRVLKPHLNLHLTLVKMRSLIFKVFGNARFPKSCKLIFFLFFLFFFLIRIICIEIMHVLNLFMRRRLGFLWNTKTNIQDI